MELSRAPGAGYKAVRTDRLLYIRWADGRENLYYTESDPNQLNDLANDAGDTRDLTTARDELLSRWFESDSLLPRTGHY